MTCVRPRRAGAVLPRGAPAACCCGCAPALAAVVPRKTTGNLFTKFEDENRYIRSTQKSLWGLRAKNDSHERTSDSELAITPDHFFTDEQLQGIRWDEVGWGARRVGSCAAVRDDGMIIPISRGRRAGTQSKAGRHDTVLYLTVPTWSPYTDSIAKQITYSTAAQLDL